MKAGMVAMNRRNNVSSSTPIGRVHARFHPRRETYRLRFTAIHEDQRETIFAALQKARLEAETDFDSVALELICLAYLASS